MRTELSGVGQRIAARRMASRFPELWIFNPADFAELMLTVPVVRNRCARLMPLTVLYMRANGKPPSSLHDVTDDSLATVDPYTGNRLRLRITETTLQIYSVRMDRVDNGGYDEAADEWLGEGKGADFGLVVNLDAIGAN